jgi:hypothetical protein
MAVLSIGAMAAPITAFLRIDPPKSTTFSAGVKASIATLGGLPEPRAVLVTVSGLGTAVVVLWRRRAQLQMKRRRRRVRHQLRKIAPIL